MTREEIENLVVEATGRADKTTLIRSAIDIAVEEVSTQRLWNDLQVEDEVTLFTGAVSVALASDAARISEVRLIDGLQSRPLMIRPKTWLLKQCPSPESRSPARPVYGYIEGQNLFTLPQPNIDYAIRYTYFRLHPPLTAASDSLLIRAASRAVIAYAVFWVFQTLEMAVDADRWLKSYFALMNSAMKVDKENSAVKQQADPRLTHADPQIPTTDYWLDPFVRSMP